MSRRIMSSVTSVLHVRCGDEILGKLRQAGLPGDMIRWADALCQGPTPAGLAQPAWRRIRAQHAADFYHISFEVGLDFLSQQDRALERFCSYDEVVLWFEHDLFDQIVLIYLLDWFGRQDVAETQVMLICAGQHLGYMTSGQLGELYETQHRVTQEQFALARRAWQVFCAADPTGCARLAHSDMTALPYLGDAFIRHLQEFPSVHSGLGRTEETALSVIASGVEEPACIFLEVQRREEKAWLGDAMFWPYLEELAKGKDPLVLINGDGPWPDHNGPESTRRVSLTGQGHRVLSGEEDRVRLRGLDRWLGGVHLEGRHVPWRWDKIRERLVRN